MFKFFKNSSIFRPGPRKKPNGFYFNAVQIGEQDDWIKIVPIGDFPEHPDGAHQITSGHIQQMARNFQNTGTDLLFDYEHRSLWGDTLAAGWGVEIEARDDGLYVKYPDFTPAATGKIENKEYRYFSPVYHLNYKNKQGERIGAVIDSVALTNRPYMDREIDHIRNSTEERDIMLSKEALEKLGLDENASEEQINEAILKQQQTPTEEGPPEPQADPEDGPVSNFDLEKRIQALEDQDKAGQKSRAQALINSAKADGKILPADEAVWLNAAIADYEGTRQKLDAKKKNSALPQNVQTPPSDPEPEEKKTPIEAAAEFFKNAGRYPGASKQE